MTSIPLRKAGALPKHAQVRDKRKLLSLETNNWTSELWLQHCPSDIPNRSISPSSYLQLRFHFYQELTELTFNPLLVHCLFCFAFALQVNHCRLQMSSGTTSTYKSIRTMKETKSGSSETDQSVFFLPSLSHWFTTTDLIHEQTQLTHSGWL